MYRFGESYSINSNLPIFSSKVRVHCRVFVSFRKRDAMGGSFGIGTENKLASAVLFNPF